MPWPWLLFLLQLTGAPADGGQRSVADAGAPLSAEDAEVVQNLELLEHLDAASDLELLRELSDD